MIYNLKTIRKQILGLGLSEAGTKQKGPKSEARKHLELRSKTALHGYNVAVEYGLCDDLEVIAASIKGEYTGFFYEGIGMGLFMLDRTSLFKKNRFMEFSQGPGKEYQSVMYVGAGLISGFLHLPIKKTLEKADPAKGTAIVDGVGFHYAFFKTKKCLDQQFVPKYIKENAFLSDRFDNGIGRALWFLFATEVPQMAAAIDKFPANRKGPVWYGLGFAAAYARGMNNPEEITRLKLAAGEYLQDLAEGIYVGTYMKQRHLNHQTESTALEEIIVGKKPEECDSEILEIMNTLPEAKKNTFNETHPWSIFRKKIRMGLLVREEETTL